MGPVQLPQALFQGFQPAQQRAQIVQITGAVHVAAGQGQALVQRFVPVARAVTKPLVYG
ncbi:hypothetical protein D3C77_720800 [compost metagenome]